jgi:hypothetical protein
MKNPRFDGPKARAVAQAQPDFMPTRVIMGVFVSVVTAVPAS